MWRRTDPAAQWQDDKTMQEVMLAQSTQALIEAAKPLLGNPVRELDHLLTDRVRLWRLGQAVKTVRRANAIRELKGTKHKVDPKFFLPFLEECFKEDDKDISEMWSQLLASSSGQNRF
jgi:hypothetical protein